MPTHVFGIRHHGPGCARSLVAALDELKPDCVAIEGPADAADAIALAGRDGLNPPVALLVYPPEEPKRAAYFPLTVYSPEWQAIRWALAHDVPVRLIDLPQSHRLAVERGGASGEAGETGNGDGEAPPEPTEGEAAASAGPVWRTDPLAMFAEAAGYTDHELWWEEQVERRSDATGLFAAIGDAMRAVREHAPEVRDIDPLREAFMRQALRGAIKEGFGNVAVVCGAWHAPALGDEALEGRVEGLSAKADAERLRGLPKVKTAATWIPWTYDRLTFRSGYGAGVTSPGWYGHLWESHDHAAIRWVATAARLLREADLDASSASVIEAVRLADSLAAIRDIRAAGLTELNEAILTVLCHGEPSPLRLIREKLEVGDLLGRVPEDAPAVPLARDLEAQQKSLRLRPTTEVKSLDLDLRTPSGLDRSRLLHRLNLLGLPWGKLHRSGGGASTFHEVWELQWRPEFAVAVIEANVWGNTVASAAAAKVVHDAGAATELAPLTAMLDVAVLAGLDDAVPPLLDRLQERSAVAADVRHLMESLPPLARVARYGDVRGTRSDRVLPIAVGMFERAVVGVRAAASGLDDDAAERLIGAMSGVREALDLLDRPDLTEEWHARLRGMAEDDLHGLIRGWCARQLLEAGLLAPGELDRLTRLALSPAVESAQAAAWAAGLLRGSGLLLLHRDELWPVFDGWLAGLTPEAFVELLPLLRRAFADFSPAERRQMGEKVKTLDRGPAATPVAAVTEEIDLDRAARVLPVLRQILGTTETKP